MSISKRYPTDLTDRQWALVESLLPSDPPRGPGGRPPEHPKREIVNAILYHMRAGGAWRMLPRDLPPWQTVYGYFRDWGADGTLDSLHDALREQVRTKQEQQPRALGGDRGLAVGQGRRHRLCRYARL